MKRSLFILAILTLLAGCSDQPPESSVTSTEVKTVEPSPPAVAPEAPTETPATSEFSVKSIAGKSEADVTAMFRVPYATETGEWTLLSTEEKTPFVRNDYETPVGAVSVMFIEGIAARIEVKPTTALKYPDDAIKAMQAVGLAVEDGKAPERENPLYLDYGSLGGLYNVRVVKDQEGNPENIGYVKIVTDDRYK
ncbi:hypothetical protein T458_06845 [Brevibacillus panacihumi W25]|uniref:Lipoprotein n=1 Tax=Brevibacillus panacihumi W25 TaxID=1408254 RepID=V6MAU4_9BACL|nr:membrane lipoprotein lipid attachment site-containing protein [Brevibacillus panacihumi]EST55676.1 hypothetical protein T458_06845 [Brevibacillus panacihumi W25]